MDLTQYKKAWENQPEGENKISAFEIYKMMQSKSTSIVKWILIIGILEFVFWGILNFFFSRLGYLETYEELNLMVFIDVSYYLSFIVIALFLVLFYRNYNSVSTVDDTKTLMKKILRVRKTVKLYVYFNIIFALLSMIVMNVMIINTPGGMETMLGKNNINLDHSELLTIYIVSQVVATIILLLILFLFYYLLYGLLLRKLNKNYKELTRLENIS